MYMAIPREDPWSRDAEPKVKPESQHELNQLT